MERRFRAIQRIGDEVPVSHDDDFFEGWPLHRKSIGAVYIHTLFADEMLIHTSWHTHCGEPGADRMFFGHRAEVQFER